MLHLLFVVCISTDVPPPPTSPTLLSSLLVTNDTVKVEVWDIVDKGKVQRKESKSVLKLFNNPTENQVRDSSFSCNLLPL